MIPSPDLSKSQRLSERRTRCVRLSQGFRKVTHALGHALDIPNTPTNAVIRRTETPLPALRRSWMKRHSLSRWSDWWCVIARVCARPLPSTNPAPPHRMIPRTIAYITTRKQISYRQTPSIHSTLILPLQCNSRGVGVSRLYSTLNYPLPPLKGEG